jgi:hypothetical protein
MDRLKWMGAVGVAAALLCTGAPAWAGDEYYKPCINCEGKMVSVCPTLPHYPNAHAYDPDTGADNFDDKSFDSRSAHTRTNDAPGVVAGWFQGHLGPDWTYRPPARDEWPQTYYFWGPARWTVEIRSDKWPTQILFVCDG